MLDPKQYHTMKSLGAEMPKFVTGNVMAKPLNTSQVPLILGTLPKDLATCMLVQFQGERESLHKHAPLCVSVQQLKVAFNWLLTHNWDWIDAASAFCVDGPAGNYRSAINALLQACA